MKATDGREKVRFTSGGEECAAWRYPGSNGACVVMAGGFAVPKEPATDLFARRFAEAGFEVLAFDYRGLGESDGLPRLVQPVGDLIDDWEAAIDFARTLPGVEATKVAAWGFSASGGLVLSVAARRPDLGAAIAQTPLVDAPASAPKLSRYSTPIAQLRLLGRGVLDTIGGALGRPPLPVPLVGKKGSVAMLSTPDALEGNVALNGGDHPQWEQKVAARSVLRLSAYRPGRRAAAIRCPVLFVVCDDDRSAPSDLTERVASRVPGGEVARLRGRHYAPFMESHEEAVDAQVSFLRAHLVERSREPALT
jgi:pimeloyl-ACP methyl ester carboxylesterase